MVEHRANEKPTPPPPGERPRPFLPPPQASLDYLSSGTVRPTSAAVAPLSSIHFLVHPGMPEVQAYAAERGWLAQGFTQLSITWLELRYTTDGWKTSHVLHSTDVPCPVVNGFFFLPNVPLGVEVEFAVHAGLACHAPSDTAGSRDTGELWFNNGGANFRQLTR
ncbi:MAG: hypothetical protein AB1938_07550 [Myxococcota bacterium]